MDKAGLVGKTLGQRKNDYGDGGIFFSLFLAPKVNSCLTSNEYGFIEEKRHSKFLEMLLDYWKRKDVLKCNKVKK